MMNVQTVAGKLRESGKEQEQAWLMKFEDRVGNEGRQLQQSDQPQSARKPFTRQSAADCTATNAGTRIASAAPLEHRDFSRGVLALLVVGETPDLELEWAANGWSSSSDSSGTSKKTPKNKRHGSQKLVQGYLTEIRPLERCCMRSLYKENDSSS